MMVNLFDYVPFIIRNCFSLVFCCVNLNEEF